MAENNALPYMAENSSNIGNYIFDKVETPLAVHLDNLKRIDAAQAEHWKTQQAKMGLISKMYDGLNPKFDGASAFDVKFLQGKADELHQEFADILGKGLNPLEHPDAFNKINQDKSRLALWTAAAVDRNKQGTLYHNALDADAKSADPKFEKNSGANGYAEFMTTPIDKYSEGNVDWDSKILVPKVPDLDLSIDKYINLTYKKPTVTQTNDSPANASPDEIWMHKTTENMPQGHIRTFAETAPSMPNLKPSVDKWWTQEKIDNPDGVSVVMDKYLKQNQNPTLAEDNAKKDLLEAKVLHQHYQNSDEFIYRGLSANGKKALIYTRSGATQQKDALFGDAANLADYWNGKKGAGAAFTDVKLQPFQKIETIQVPDPNDPSKTIPKQQITLVPNKITDMGITPEGKHWIVTTESQDLFSQNKFGNQPEIEFESPRALTSYIGTRTANGKWANGVDQAFRMSKALKADQDYDTEGYAPPAKWDAPKIKPAPKAQQPPVAIKKIKVTLDGTIGEIPEDQWEAFHKKHPTATK